MKETLILPNKLSSFVNALPCPTDCPIGTGAIQVVHYKDETKAGCYQCGMKVDLDTVKIVYETKEENAG